MKVKTTTAQDAFILTKATYEVPTGGCQSIKANSSGLSSFDDGSFAPNVSHWSSCQNLLNTDVD